MRATGAAVSMLAAGSVMAGPDLLLAYGPPTERLTLRAAIAMALQNNAQIQTADLAKVVEEERIKVAMQAFDFHLEGGYLYQHIDSPQNAQDYVATGGGSFSLLNPVPPLLTKPSVFEQRNHIGRLGLAKKLEFGTIVELGATMRVLDNTLNRRSPPALFNPEWETFTGLTVTQPLLRDRGKAANTAEIRIAKANVTLADLEWQSRAAQVVAEVMKRYYDVIFALDHIAVQEESIELARKLMGDTQARGREGVAAANEALVAEAGVNQRIEDALAAEMAYIESQNALQLLIKTPEEVIAGSSRVQPADRMRMAVPATDRDSLVQLALARRREVQQAEEWISVKSAEMDYAENQARARLDLIASGGYHGLEGDLAGSYRNAARGDGMEWTAGLQFSLPLGADNRKARVRAAQAQRTQAYVQRSEIRLRVALEVDTVVGRLQMGMKRLAATRKSREAAAQSAEGGLKRLVEGLGTSFEVLQLQKEFTQARSREYSALADLNKDLVDLHLATGTLLEKQGVTVETSAAEIQEHYVPVVPLGDLVPEDAPSRSGTNFRRF